MIGLSAAVVFTVLLPLAAASAGPGGPEGEDEGPTEAAPASVTGDQKTRQDEKALSGSTPDRVAEERKRVVEERSGLPGRTRTQCGPEVASPEGVEAQTCVLVDGREAWARTYYRNTTGEQLDAVLALMGPAGRTVRTHCAVGADDEPGSCETPHGPTGDGGDGPAKYAAVSEFASPGEGPLLLRSGSNSAAPTPR